MSLLYNHISFCSSSQRCGNRKRKENVSRTHVGPESARLGNWADDLDSFYCRVTVYCIWVFCSYMQNTNSKNFHSSFYFLFVLCITHEVFIVIEV